MIRPPKRLPAGEGCQFCRPVSEWIVGRPVESADGVRIGTVRAGLGYAIAIQPPDGVPFPLPIDAIATTGATAVRLHVNAITVARATGVLPAGTTIPASALTMGELSAAD